MVAMLLLRKLSKTLTCTIVLCMTSLSIGSWEVRGSCPREIRCQTVCIVFDALNLMVRSVFEKGGGGQAYASDWLIPWHVPRAVRTEVISFITYCVKPEVKLRVIVVLRLTINYYCYCCKVGNEISLPPFKFAKQLKLGESVSVSHHFRVS